MNDEELRALPAAVPLATAARALGIGRTKAYELARAGQFPCPVLPVGSRFRVPRTALFQLLGVSAGNAAQTESAPASSSAAPVLPAEGIPVILVLQAVVLPGNWEQFAGPLGRPTPEPSGE